MNPQEKAKELVDKFQFILTEKQFGKECALIAVEQILSAPFENSYIEVIPEDQENTDWFWDHFRKYWNDVKNEIIIL